MENLFLKCIWNAGMCGDRKHTGQTDSFRHNMDVLYELTKHQIKLVSDFKCWLKRRLKLYRLISLHCSYMILRLKCSCSGMIPRVEELCGSSRFCQLASTLEHILMHMHRFSISLPLLWSPLSIQDIIMRHVCTHPAWLSYSYQLHCSV